jgi:hypothetical protein
MTVRRFNYTGRKRIEKQLVDIQVEDGDSDSAPTFTAELDLDGLGLPPDAQLIIEAKRERSSRRFHWGTAANPTPPQDCRLTDMPPNAKFRVMALDPDGSCRILALGDNISAKLEGAGSAESLLWLEEMDLGKDVWRMDFAEPGDNPRMLVNKCIQGISEAARQDEAFQALVLPEALRAVLHRALIVEDTDISDEDGPWSSWIGFVGEFYKADFPNSSDDAEIDKKAKSDWIDGAVAAFTTQRFHASDKYATARSQR